MKKNALWVIYEVSPVYGDARLLVAEYGNRGHAVAKLRGLRRKAGLTGSPIEYALRRG